jgi:hypothetical protein
VGGSDWLVNLMNMTWVMVQVYILAGIADLLLLKEPSLFIKKTSDGSS